MAQEEEEENRSVRCKEGGRTRFHGRDSDRSTCIQDGFTRPFYKGLSNVGESMHCCIRKMSTLNSNTDRERGSGEEGGREKSSLQFFVGVVAELCVDTTDADASFSLRHVSVGMTV